MATPDQPSARFRSATEFPKTIASCNAAEANRLYEEMRDCLIFTNRSRSQLIRRNEEHKQAIGSLRNDLARFQSAINQLNLEKQELTQANRAVIAELQHEILSMSGHLDQLSKAFEEVEGVNSAMGVMAIPGRFAKFWQSLRALISWWRDEQGDGNPQKRLDPTGSDPALGRQPRLDAGTSDISPNSDSDRRENPQMYTDPASVQRSLRDE